MTAIVAVVSTAITETAVTDVYYSLLRPMEIVTDTIT